MCHLLTSVLVMEILNKNEPNTVLPCTSLEILQLYPDSVLLFVFVQCSANINICASVYTVADLHYKNIPQIYHKNIPHFPKTKYNTTAAFPSTSSFATLPEKAIKFALQCLFFKSMVP